MNKKFKISLGVAAAVAVSAIAITPAIVSAWGNAGDGSPIESKTSLSWNVGAGVDLIKHVRVAAAYNISLSKEKMYRDNSWSLSAAYMF